MEQSRRSFIQKAALGLAGAAAIPFISKSAPFNSAAADEAKPLPIAWQATHLPGLIWKNQLL